MRSRPREKSVGMDDSAEEMKLLDIEALKIKAKEDDAAGSIGVVLFDLWTKSMGTWKLCEWRRQRTPWFWFNIGDV